MDVRNANGAYNNDPFNCIEKNPWGLIHENKNDRNRTMVNGHVDLKFNIAKGLTFTTTNAVDYNDYKTYTMGSK